MSFSSDELNFLIYRYLQESGFHHSSFTFGYESGVAKSPINALDVSPGCLINAVQKGLQYMEIEAHIREDGGEVECDEQFSLIAPHECKVKEQRRRKGRAKKEVEEAEPMDEEAAGPVEITDDHVTVLEGHQSEVFMCAWSPTASLLASGSGDSSARIWTIDRGPCGRTAAQLAMTPIVLNHTTNNNERSKDITTLDWNREGTLLATGSIDGLARIWSDKGELLRTLNRHKQPIFSLKWNRAGTYLLSGSVDKTAIVWETASGEVKQQFEFHQAPTLDVDWKDNQTFATCSTDKMIYVCQLGADQPIRRFEGHEDEVNAVKWDPAGMLLASCSDDNTAKVWRMDSDRCILDLREHTKEIYTIKWNPASASLGFQMLASASFDNTVKLWDITRGRCLHNLTAHADPVYSVAFSPTGEYLATGSSDQCLHIWSARDGRLLRTYRGRGGIFEVCWNNAGDKVAACFSNNTVCVIDFRR